MIETEVILRGDKVYSMFKCCVLFFLYMNCNYNDWFFSEIKCLDKNDELTALGKILARLPIEPRVGKMMILGSMFRVRDALSTMA